MSPMHSGACAKQDHPINTKLGLTHRNLKSLCENYVGALFLSQHQSINPIKQEKNNVDANFPKSVSLG